MEKRNRRWLKIGFFVLLISIVIFRYRSYLVEGFREIAMIPMAQKVGIFLASTGYMLVEGKIIVRLAKVFRMNIKWKTGVRCAYYCNFARTVTVGGGAGAAEIYYLNNEGMEPAHAFVVSLIQYLCQKVAVTFLGAMSLLFFFQNVDTSIGKYRTYLACGIGLAVVLVALILSVSLSKKIAGILFGFLDWIGERKRNWKCRTETWKKQVIFGQDGVKAILQDKGGLAEIFILSLIKYFCWFSIPYLLYKERGVLLLFSSISMMAIATVMASVIPVPGGYGALEFMQMMLFEPIIGKGRTVSMVILYRVATTFIPTIIGGVAAFFNKRKNHGEYPK